MLMLPKQLFGAVLNVCIRDLLCCSLMLVNDFMII